MSFLKTVKTTKISARSDKVKGSKMWAGFRKLLFFATLEKRKQIVWDFR